jgi:hypothetical protein
MRNKAVSRNAETLWCLYMRLSGVQAAEGKASLEEVESGGWKKTKSTFMNAGRVAPNFQFAMQPENRGAVVCRALTNRTETPFLAQLLSL